MKQIAELVPIVLFFLAYQMDGTELSVAGFTHRFDGIYSATAVLMAATAVQILLTRLLTGHLEKRLLVLGALVMVFGAATLALHNQLFIQWKPTIFNWGIAAALLGVRWWTGRSLLESAMDGQISLPPEGWRRLERLWVANFLVVGALNLVVAYGFSEAAWVSYKLYSAIGFTILLSGLTVLVLMPYLREAEGDGQPPGAA